MRRKAEATDRLLGASGLVGGVLGLLNTPLVVSASARAFRAAHPDGPPPGASFLDPLLGFAEPVAVYAAYGRVWAPVLLLYLLGAAGLYIRLDPAMDRRTRTTFSVLMAGLLLLVIGVVADYWLGPEVLGRAAWGAAFLIFTLVGVLVASAASAFLGVRLYRQERVPPWASLPFVLVPLGFPLVPIIPNLPAAPLFVMAFAWIANGVFLLRTPRSAANAANPAPDAS